MQWYVRIRQRTHRKYRLWHRYGPYEDMASARAGYERIKERWGDIPIEAHYWIPIVEPGGFEPPSAD